MEHAMVFSDFEEFSKSGDVIQLQSQLGHARREIDHLHRIQDGLRAELAEAHSIFEQIHQHPIAGPIVRIRERVIQFMKRNRKED
jgi:transcriptional regulator of NAD metabolism